MKRFLPLGLALIAFTAMAEPSWVPSQVVVGIYTNCVSPNGQWMGGEIGSDESIAIHNTWTGEKWIYERIGDNAGYELGINSRSVSNDGTAVGEIAGIPSYWRNGKWYDLPLAGPTETAAVGSISADGSIIVGALGNTGMTVDNVQMDYACVWYRKADGTYDKPVFLPNPGKDFVGHAPQYVHALSVSDDGNVIAGIMRSGSGRFNTPLLYVRDSKGNWSVQQLALNLTNPSGRPVPEVTDEYDGPSLPNYEDYLKPGVSDNELSTAFDKWFEENSKPGLSEDEVMWLAYVEFFPQFMTGEKKTEYEEKVNAWYNAYVPWQKAYDDYLAWIETLENEGVNFLFNNAYVSPDGKKVFYTGSVYDAAVMGNLDDPLYFPVMIDVATLDYQTCSRDKSIIITSVASDYSIFGQNFNNQDKYFYRNGYVFPQGQFESVDIPSYILQNKQLAAYDWMEEYMYRGVVTGLTDTGAELFDDAWTIGLPFCTTDQSLIYFANTTTYWESNEFGNYEFLSFLLNTGFDDAEVEVVAADKAPVIKVLPGARVEVAGNVDSLKVYDLSGACVFSAAAPSGVVSTGLPSGVYVVQATASGETSTIKALF